MMMMKFNKIQIQIYDYQTKCIAMLTPTPLYNITYFHILFEPITKFLDYFVNNLVKAPYQNNTILKRILNVELHLMLLLPYLAQH